MILAHLSDLHFGKLCDAHVVECLVNDVQACGASAVVISGDLTQRARKREWRGAEQLIADLAADPTIVIPGNHDVFAWWFPIRRLVTPLTRYQTYIRPQLDMEWSDGSVAVLALNDAHGWTVKGGRFSLKQLDRLRAFGQSHSSARHRVLVVHHQIVPSQFTGRGDVATRSAELLGAAGKARIDVVLDGHIHRSSNRVIPAGTSDWELIQCTGGTATSSRGRFEDTGRNLYNLIRLGETVTIEERCYNREARRFERERSSSYRRLNTGWTYIDDKRSET